jgi:hypothetical protein
MNETDVFIPEHMTETEQQSTLEFIKKLRIHHFAHIQPF